MSYSCNITFVVGKEEEEHLQNYLKGLIPVLFSSGGSATSPSLKKVIEIGGDPVNEETGLSIALSSDFKAVADILEWQESNLMPALENFSSEFGGEGVYFITLLENLVIKNM
ncbi:MAG: hypothetical protein J1E78_06340 [Muribaculaceae bacterium]|nr:hypothetical protein [Muribaculaceae bacterium]